ETDALDLGNITASALTVTAGGAVSDSGTLTVSGTTDIDTSAGNADITLNTNTHSLATLIVDAGTGAVDVDETDALTLQVDGAGDVTVDSVGALTLNAGSMSNLTVTAASSITDAGALAVSGTTDLDTSTANGAIVLDTFTHNLNTFTADAGTGAIDIDETDALDLGDTTTSALTITAGGAVSDSGTLTVSGTTDIDTSAGNGAITLNTNTHSLNTLVVDSGTGNVDIDETDALTLQVDGAGDVTVDSVGALTLNAGSMANLTVTDADSVTDAGVLTVTTAVDVDTSANNGAVDLGNNTHNLASFTANAGTGAVTIDETDAISLGAITASTLDVTAGGAISSTDALTLSGNLTVDTSAGNANVTLDDSANSLAGSVAVNAGTGTVTIEDTTALDLGAITAGSLDVTSGGDLTDSGNVVVGTLAFDAAGSVTLDSVDLDVLADSAAQGNVAITTNANSNDTLTINDIIITDSSATDDETSYTVSISETQGSAETEMLLTGDIKGSDGSSDLYLGKITITAGTSNERQLDSDGNAMLKAKSLALSAHGNMGRDNAIDVDWKASTASSVNRLTINLGDLDAVDIDNNGDHSNNNSDFDDVELAIDITGFDLVDENNLLGGSREIDINFTTENSTDTTSSADLVDAANDILAGNFEELNYFNRNTFNSVNNRIDQLEALLGEGFDSSNNQTVAAYISYLVNGSDGINGFVDVNGNLISGGISASAFFNGTDGSYTTITKLGNQIASIASFYDDVSDDSNTSNDVVASAADGSDIDYAGLKSSVRAGDLNNDSTSDTLANEITAIQNDVDTNETDADNAIAAVQADVDQNELDADNAIAAVQTDVDQNELDADNAIAAVQTDVDQNELDADNAIAAVQTDVDQNELDADNAIAAVQTDVDQNELDADNAIAA
ncbi:beta strand repeat-containing protein, partial [Catenovulum agarivorans]|uniref:beta strand repeat-containing protein n=1 Tax=Catenovulum agarivorans TaxID=1172192 RepID=UPI000593CAE3